MLHFFCCKDILSCKNNSGGKFSSSFLQIRWQFVTAIFPVVIIAITSLKDVCLSQPTTTVARPGMATMSLAMPTRAWQKFPVPGGKPWKLRYRRHPLTNQITGKSVPTNRRPVLNYCFHSSEYPSPGDASQLFRIGYFEKINILGHKEMKCIFCLICNCSKA